MAKMFAGIHALHLIEADKAGGEGGGEEKDGGKKSHVTHVGGMASREGEVVLFEAGDRVSLAEDPQVKAWLRKARLERRSSNHSPQTTFERTDPLHVTQLSDLDI